MNFNTIPIAELDSRAQQVWHDILDESPELSSPFLTPEVARVASQVIDNIEVLRVAEADDDSEQENAIGFLPFQRTSSRCGGPVAVGMNEFQAAIVRPNQDFSVTQWMRAANLDTLKYDHWQTTQADLEPYHTRVGDSPYIDLSDGYDTYRSLKKKTTSSFSQLERKQRKLEREVGPTRLEMHSSDESLFQLLLDWKSAQHNETGVVDIFQFDWVLDLLRRYRDEETPGFRGLYSVLFANDQPIAVHLGLTTPRTAHLWFPSYDRTFQKYSPGMIMFLEIAKELSQLGVNRFEFGPGPQRYKQNLMSAAGSVAIGTVDCSPARRLARRAWNQTREALRQSPLRSGLSAPSQILFRMKQWLNSRKEGLS